MLRESNKIPKYIDIDLDFKPNPLYEKGDIKLKKDNDAVEQSIKNILMTRQGERPFKSDFGGTINDMLFDDADDKFNLAVMRVSVENDVKKFEPRVGDASSDVIDVQGRDSGLNVQINYGTEITQEQTQVLIRRTR